MEIILASEGSPERGAKRRSSCPPSFGEEKRTPDERRYKRETFSGAYEAPEKSSYVPEPPVLEKRTPQEYPSSWVRERSRAPKITDSVSSIFARSPREARKEIRLNVPTVESTAMTESPTKISIKVKPECLCIFVDSDNS